MIESYLSHMDDMSEAEHLERTYDAVALESGGGSIHGPEADYYMELQLGPESPRASSTSSEPTYAAGASFVRSRCEPICSPSIADPLPGRRTGSPCDIYAFDKGRDGGAGGVWLAELGGAAAWRARIFYEADQGIKRRRLLP